MTSEETATAESAQSAGPGPGSASLPPPAVVLSTIGTLSPLHRGAVGLSRREHIVRLWLAGGFSGTVVDQTAEQYAGWSRPEDSGRSLERGNKLGSPRDHSTPPGRKRPG